MVVLIVVVMKGKEILPAADDAAPVSSYVLHPQTHNEDQVCSRFAHSSKLAWKLIVALTTRALSQKMKFRILDKKLSKQ